MLSHSPVNTQPGPWAEKALVKEVQSLPLWVFQPLKPLKGPSSHLSPGFSCGDEGFDEGFL